MPLNVYAPEQLRTNKYFFLNLLSQYAKYNLELNADMGNDDLDISEYIYYIEQAKSDYEEGKIEFEITD